MKKPVVTVAMTVFTSLGMGLALSSQAQESAQPQNSEAAWSEDFSEILTEDASGETSAPASEAETAEAASADAGTASADPAPTNSEGAAGEEGPIVADETAESSSDVDGLPIIAVEQDPVPMPDEPERASRGGIEEIVVTARRTEENLQDVPVAISALSAADLAREGISTAQDLQGRVPSLVISPGAQTRNTESPTIRGQGATFGASPGVVMYYAEVPLPSDSFTNAQGGPGKFFDLSNMQVLKGAQGTLFGRNTTGGALLLEPAKPTEEFSGSVAAETTSFSGRGYEGVLNTPLVGDSLLLRVGAKYFDREGFTHDVVTGKDYDSKHFWTSRLGLMWRPTDGVENYLLGYYTKSDDNGSSNVVEAINSEGFNQAILTAAGAGPLPGVPPQFQPGCAYFNANAPSTNCGQDIVAEQRARDHRHVQLSADPNDILETGGVINSFSFDLTESLTLRNIASYSFYRHHFRWDVDGSRAAINDNEPPDDSNSSDSATYTEELQLQGTAFDERLTFAVGGYYEYQEPRGTQETYVTALFNRVYQNYEFTRETYGPYAQGTYGLGGISESLEPMSLTVGARYTFDKLDGRSRINDSETSASTDDSALTWTVGLDYKLENGMAYGKVSRGYKSGGFSAVAVNPDHLTFGPEFVTNYELGYKSDLEIATVPVRFNTAVYLTDYTDMQRSTGDSYLEPDSPPGATPHFGGAIYNAGKASIGGLEIDATVAATERLTLIGSYSYTKAEYEEYEILVGGVTPPLDCSGRRIPRGEIADYSCIPFQYTPKHQWSASTRYLLPFDESVGEVEASLTYAWTGERYSSGGTHPEDEPGAWLDALGLLNGAIRWDRIMQSNFSAQLYGTNLLDKDYRLANSNVWQFVYVQSSIYGEPRVIGLSLRYDWGQ